jgi:acetyl esterase/lipase
VPRIAKCLDLQESASYENITEEKIRVLEPHILDLSRDYPYHIDSQKWDQQAEVMIRLLAPYALQHVDFAANKCEKPLVPIRKAIIHFHGGGFVCQDSASHQCYTR